MNNEIRNELLGLLSYVKSKDEDKDIQLDILLDRFEIDIKRKLEDLEYEKRELKDNLRTLEYVKEQLKENL